MRRHVTSVNTIPRHFIKELEDLGFNVETFEPDDERQVQFSAACETGDMLVFFTVEPKWVTIMGHVRKMMRQARP